MQVYTPKQWLFVASTQHHRPRHLRKVSVHPRSFDWHYINIVKRKTTDIIIIECTVPRSNSYYCNALLRSKIVIDRTWSLPSKTDSRINETFEQNQQKYSLVDKKGTLNHDYRSSRKIWFLCPMNAAKNPWTTNNSIKWCIKSKIRY